MSTASQNLLPDLKTKQFFEDGEAQVIFDFDLQDVQTPRQGVNRAKIISMQL